jgi:hypothetical protein
MFVRARKARGQVYYQLVRGYRDAEGKVRQETLGLGVCETVAEALEYEQRAVRRARSQRGRWRDVGHSDFARLEFERLDKIVKASEAKIVKLEEAQRQGAR